MPEHRIPGHRSYISTNLLDIYKLYKWLGISMHNIEIIPKNVQEKNDQI